MFIKIIKLYFFKKKRRKLNKNNHTFAVNLFDCTKVSIGNFTYGGIKAYFFYSGNEFLKIGNFCSIATGVTFLCGGEHNYKGFFTFPLSDYFKHTKSARSKGPIIVDDDVWIGENAMILSGVHIGKGAIIAAGATVVCDVEPYTIVGGCPAKLIKKRFDDRTIKELVKVDLSIIDKDFIESEYDFLSKSNINFSDVSELHKKILEYKFKKKRG